MANEVRIEIDRYSTIPELVVKAIGIDSVENKIIALRSILEIIDFFQELKGLPKEPLDMIRPTEGYVIIQSDILFSNQKDMLKACQSFEKEFG